jgi:HPt (histidine-containing phosphotransfer) domain-containing protein
LGIEKPNTYALNQEIIAAALQVQASRLRHLKSERIDAEALKNRVDGDLDLLRDLAALFAEEAPRLLGQIELAIQRGSAIELEKASHKMKGSVLQFSAAAAASAALELEQKGRSGSVAGAEVMLDGLRNEIALLEEALRTMLSNG